MEWGLVLIWSPAFQCTLDPDTSDPTDNLTEWAVEFCQRVGSKATTVSEIVRKKDEAVYQAIEEGIQRVNMNAAAQPYHIQKWAILEKDFSISGGELGRFFSFHYSRGCGRAEAMTEPGRWLLGSSHNKQKVTVSTLDDTHLLPTGRHWILSAWACGCVEPIKRIRYVLELINLKTQHLILLSLWDHFPLKSPNGTTRQTSWPY